MSFKTLGTSVTNSTMSPPSLTLNGKGWHKFCNLSQVEQILKRIGTNTKVRNSYLPHRIIDTFPRILKRKIIR